MNSFKIILITICSFFFINLNAQLFVGGNVGFNTSNSDNEQTIPQKSSSYNLNIRPFAGKFLSEKLAIGLAIDLSMAGGENANTYKSTGIGVNPFLRYYPVKLNKFSVFGQGNIGVVLTNSSDKTGGITSKQKQTRTYLNVYPGLSYDISEKLSLETTINILNFGYSYSTFESGNSKAKSSNFNIGGGLSNVVSVNAITIGAIYRF